MTTRGGAGERRRDRPARLLVAAVTVAARALPDGEPRERYTQEFVSDLHVLGRRRQAAYALGVLSRTWTLRAAVSQQVRLQKGSVMDTMTPRKPLTCALNLHHHYRTVWTEDGGRFRRCARCGKIEPGSDNPMAMPYGAAGFW